VVFNKFRFIHDVKKKNERTKECTKDRAGARKYTLFNQSKLGYALITT
jgi:hypothetical protein